MAPSLVIPAPFSQEGSLVFSTLAITSDTLVYPCIVAGLLPLGPPDHRAACTAILAVTLFCQCCKCTQEKTQSTFHSCLTNPHQWTCRQPGPQCRTGQDGHLSLKAGTGEGNGQSTPAFKHPGPLPSSFLNPQSALPPGSGPPWLPWSLQ